MVAYTALTAARVITLPASSAYPTGTRLVIIDETGNCSVTKTLTVNAAGTDTIDGAASAVVNQAYGFIGLESNGAGHWTIIDQGFMPALANLAAAAHGANDPGAGDRDRPSPCRALLPTLRSRSRPTASSSRLARACSTAITGATSYEVGRFAATFRSSVRLLAIAAGSSNFGLIGPTAFYTNTTSDHHRGWRFVHRRPGQAIDFHPSRKSFRRVAAFSFQ